MSGVHGPTRAHKLCTPVGSVVDPVAAPVCVHLLGSFELLNVYITDRVLPPGDHAS